MANEKVLIVSLLGSFDFDLIENFRAHGWTIQFDSVSDFDRLSTGKFFEIMADRSNSISDGEIEDMTTEVKRIFTEDFIAIPLDFTDNISEADMAAFLKEIEND